ncbi:NnrS family protein [Rubellimicrobium aerolatum]|uniref:NnrS family protein n=1 Tax=Rubellimicrobium aerolatum TaxID=490979 RepID=A0ABW0SGP1_9RHOB|nr:NnrS family protein [Rubellimicrobium aerolatum]MBP1807409.1 uncharacterized protein involved in response to NO [Rubellimicrobium aerolatum]
MSSPRSPHAGPALLSHGFRPFFLLASSFATLAVPAWMLAWTGRLELAGPFVPTDWHIHEMIYGFGGAVVAGFLFTAVPNWTGRMPVRGWPLAALGGLWALGRVAVAGGLPLGAGGVAVVDVGFLAVVAAMILREIVAGRNWRNLMVLIPVTVLLAGNAAFHAEAMREGSADLGRRLGIGVMVFLILLIGGRIIPSFTRNWLAKRGAERMPVPTNRFDMACLIVSAVALLAWAVVPGPVTGAGLAVAGVAQAVRMARWRGGVTWRSPLLVMLHVAFAFAPLGLVATGAAEWGWWPLALGLHLWGVGAIGGMTLAVMMRATMGHTGRELVAGPWLSAAFGAVVVAAALRSVWPEAEVAGVTGLDLAAALWTVAFGSFVLKAGPWLVGPSAGRRTVNP